MIFIIIYIITVFILLLILFVFIRFWIYPRLRKRRQEQFSMEQADKLMLRNLRDEISDKYWSKNQIGYNILYVYSLSDYTNSYLRYTINPKDVDIMNAINNEFKDRSKNFQFVMDDSIEYCEFRHMVKHLRYID